jgi:hypothetical protein
MKVHESVRKETMDWEESSNTSPMLQHDIAIDPLE